MEWRILLRRVRRRLGHQGLFDAAGSRDFFSEADIPWVCDTFFTHGSAPGSPWDALRDAHLRLPDWFVSGLHPLSPEYAAQQHRLWRVISGVDRPYDVEIDEKEHSWGDVDAVRRPAYFVRTDPQAIAAASDHVIAAGMFLKHAGLQAGDWALEYGAGFGQIALTFARLGVNVDTVDVSQTFCEYVQRQAEFFQVPLTPHHGRFGLRPRSDIKYKLIWFYESFHHCLEFEQLIGRLKELLAPGGRVILGGEPIMEREYAAVPYPWGVRLHSEVVAVVRRHHWFELGFTEDFLCRMFSIFGFCALRVDCEPSRFGRLHVFEPRPQQVEVGPMWLPPVMSEGWCPPSRAGRWTKGDAELFVDATPSFAALEVDLGNPSVFPRMVRVEYGKQTETVMLWPRSHRTIRFQAETGTGELKFRRPAAGLVGIKSGAFVRCLRYLA